MSFLAPLYLLGALAIALPILLHLTRRTTRTRQEFSSLMFLEPEPIRVRKLNRVENILLLLLRCAVILLLAFLFARPFVSSSLLDSGVEADRKLVYLVDASASMQRDGLWDKAVAKVSESLEGITDTDRVAVMLFDDTVNPLVSFEQWVDAQPANRRAFALDQLKAAEPSWRQTDVGGALVEAAEALEDDEATTSAEGVVANAKKIVLVSDMQDGARIEAMQTYQWPEEVQVVLFPVDSPRPTNASMARVTDAETVSLADTGQRPKLRVFNSADAESEQLVLRWAGAGQADPMDVYVPPGRSRVVEAPPTPAGFTGHALVLEGDAHAFDNQLYVAERAPALANILHIGRSDAQSPSNPLYYLTRALQETKTLSPRVTSRRGADDVTEDTLEDATAVVVTDIPSADLAAKLHDYVTQGGFLVYALPQDDDARQLSTIIGREVTAVEGEPDNYALLADVNFSDPLMRPFASARFGDFTKVNFWRYRKLGGAVDEGTVVANFDSGDPAWLRFPVGQGAALVMTAGWTPAESQLALSTKFVPLVYSMLELAGVELGGKLQYYVGDAIPLLAEQEGQEISVVLPSGAVERMEPGQREFRHTDEPGVYTIRQGGAETQVAVNIQPSESLTSPMSEDRLAEFEQLAGGALAADISAGILSEEERRKLQNTEQEQRQKLWRYLLLATLIVLLIESVYAAWLNRSRATDAAQPA